jgi:chromatin assembly factor 1 subunit B
MSHIYNIHTGRALQRLDGHNNRVLGVAWDPRGQLIVSQSTDRTARVYARSKRGTWYVKAQLKEVPQSLGEGSSPTNALAEKKWKLFISESHYPNDPTAHFFRRGEFSPDGSMVILPGGLSNSDETNGVSKFVLHMYNRKQLVTNNSPTAVFCTPCSPSITVRFHPRKFISPEGNSFYVFAVTTATSFYVLRSDKSRPIAFGTDIHCTSIVDAAWSSDATKLIVCSTDGYVTLVEFAEGELGGVPDWTAAEVVAEKQEEVEEEKIDTQVVDQSEAVTEPVVGNKRRITPVVIGGDTLIS